jgi:hypothetical protein
MKIFYENQKYFSIYKNFYFIIYIYIYIIEIYLPFIFFLITLLLECLPVLCVLLDCLSAPDRCVSCLAIAFSKNSYDSYNYDTLDNI